MPNVYQKPTKYYRMPYGGKRVDMAAQRNITCVRCESVQKSGAKPENVAAGKVKCKKCEGTEFTEPVETQPVGLKKHEIENLERIIRKAVKRDGGFRREISDVDTAAKEAAIKALKALGRKAEAGWDRTIDLNMVNESTAVVPKNSPNSID